MQDFDSLTNFYQTKYFFHNGTTILQIAFHKTKSYILENET